MLHHNEKIIFRLLLKKYGPNTVKLLLVVDVSLKWTHFSSPDHTQTHIHLTPLHITTSCTQDIRFYSKEKCLSNPTKSPSPARGCSPFEPTLIGGHPLLNSPVLYIQVKGRLKTINIFSHFMCLSLTPITNILECIVTLGTHSQLRRGQMSHIGDINPLKVIRYIIVYLAILLKLSLNDFLSFLHQMLVYGVRVMESRKSVQVCNQLGSNYLNHGTIKSHTSNTTIPLHLCFTTMIIN